MPQVRLIAIDVDGTLCARGDEVAWAARAAVRRAVDAGVIVLLATGRRYRTTRAVVDALALPIEAVCLGGALRKGPAGTTLDSQPFDAEAAGAAIDAARALGLAVIVQRDGHLHEQRDFIVDDQVAGNPPTERYLAAGRAWGSRGDAAAVAQAGEALVLGALGEPAVLARLAATLSNAFPGRFGTVCMPSANQQSHYLEIVRPNVHKWHGIAAVAAREGIDAGAVCAIGDERNDVPMLAAAGLAIAMGNAPAEVRAHADWVAPAADAHGVAVAIDAILDGRLVPR
jgi:hypothetical protein